MDYVDIINTTLVPNITESETVLDLFAGCGGLSLGFEAAGYLTNGYDFVIPAVETYKKNLKGSCIRSKLEVGFDYPSADIIIGGPPCQPFSQRGKQRGNQDDRDGFPIFIDAVKRLQPKLFLFENVKNLIMPRHKWYFDSVIEELRSLDYIISWKKFKASEYGVPQNRERVIVVGRRVKDFSFPNPDEHIVSVSEAIGDTMKDVIDEKLVLTPLIDSRIERYETITGCQPRELKLDKPCRTLTCGNLGTGSDLVRVCLPDGRRRMLTHREAARIQSFPDWFEFCGGDAAINKQIGNAVPPLLSYKIACCIKECLKQPQLTIDEIRKINSEIEKATK